MKVIITMVAPLGSVSDDWVKDKIDMLLDIMKELRPELATVIETPEGMEWFSQSLTGIKKTLFSY